MTFNYKNRHSERASEYKQRLYAKGLCVGCGKPRSDIRIHCESCRKKVSERLRDRTRKRLESGLCVACGKPRAELSKRFCQKHWFEKIAETGTGKKSNGIILQEMIEKQDYKCAYTNKPIKLGLNAQLDHKVPIERGGTNEISNLQWVDAEINNMKAQRTPDEFIELCKLIVAVAG